jgi:hypothetical protein
MTTVDDLRAAARRARGDADALRAGAAALDRSAVHDLTRLAGDRTWVGPTAARVELAAAADVLRHQASRLDDEARELEHAAARAQLAPAT